MRRSLVSFVPLALGALLADAVPQEDHHGFEVRRAGHAWMVVQHGLRVAGLAGDPRRVARDHVRLLGEDFERSYFVVAESKVVRSLGALLPPNSRARAERIVDALLFDVMALDGEDDRGVVQGVAEAGGHSLRACRRAYLGPDAQHLLVAAAARLGLLDARTGVLDRLGCSSVVLFGERTADGERIFGRNQDYPGLGFYDRMPLVSFVTPRRGHRYVALAPAGVPTAGITAMNDAGLALALHSGLTGYVNPRGLPILTLTHRIVQHCASIDEAVALVDRLDRERGFASGWLIHLTDRKDGVARAAVVEVDAEGYSVSWRSDGVSCLANAYTAPPRRAGELHVAFSTSFHNVARQQRLENLANAPRTFDVHRTVDLMRDRTDQVTGEAVSYSPWILAALDQTEAAVLLPDEGAIWVAVGRAPVTEGLWVRLSLRDAFAGRYVREGLGPAVRLGHAPPLATRFPAYAAFRDAYVARHQEGDLAAALAHLERALALEDSPWFRLAAGALALRLGRTAAARAHLTRILADPHLPAHHHRLARFYLACALDADGAHSRARELFASVAAAPRTWPTLRRAAASWREHAFPRSRLGDVDLHLKYMDQLDPPRRRAEPESVRAVLEGLVQPRTR